MSAPERVGVKKTTGYASNWWGVLTDAFDEDAVEYVRADRLTEAVEALRETSDILAALTFDTIYMRGQYIDREESVARARAEAAEAENERLKAEVERLQGAVALLGGRVDAQDMRDASSLDLAREWEDHCKRAEAALADARAAAFEEAAKVADPYDPETGPHDAGPTEKALARVAAAIRALAAHGEKG